MCKLPLKRRIFKITRAGRPLCQKREWYILTHVHRSTLISTEELNIADAEGRTIDSLWEAFKT